MTWEYIALMSGRLFAGDKQQAEPVEMVCCILPVLFFKKSHQLHTSKSIMNFYSDDVMSEEGLIKHFDHFN